MPSLQEAPMLCKKCLINVPKVLIGLLVFSWTVIIEWRSAIVLNSYVIQKHSLGERQNFSDFLNRMRNSTSLLPCKIKNSFHTQRAKYQGQNNRHMTLLWVFVCKPLYAQLILLHLHSGMFCFPNETVILKVKGWCLEGLLLFISK